MNRNIAKPFKMTLSIIDIQTISPKYRCFFSEDVDLHVNVIDENKQPLDLSDVYVKVFYLNNNGEELRQDNGIIITDALTGKMTISVNKGFIGVGDSTVRIILFDEDQEVYLQPFKVTCYETGIKDSSQIIVDDGLNVRDEFTRVRGEIGKVYKDVSSSLETKANKSELDVERKRIDLLTKIENGETQGNTELLDIRIGANGVEYSNAGDMVRDIARGNGISKHSITKDKIAFVDDISIKQLLDYSQLTQGKYFSANNPSSPDNKGSSDTYGCIKLTLTKDKKYVMYAVSKDFSFFVNYNNEIIKITDFPGYEVYSNKHNTGLANDMVAIFTCPTDTVLYLSFRINMDVMLKPMVFEYDDKIYLKEYIPCGKGLNDYFEMPLIRNIKNESINSLSDVYQYVDLTKLTHGKYYQHSSTNIGTADNICLLPPFPMKKNETVYYKDVYAYFCCVKYDNGVIEPFSLETGGYKSGELTLQRDGEIYISINTTYNYLGKTVAVSNNPNGLIGNKSGYVGVVVKDLVKDITSKENIKNWVITVKKSGGDFSSVIKAVESIVDSNINNQYYIHIYDGTYDLLEELGGDTWLDTLTSGLSEMQGLLLPDYVHLIGHGTVNLVFRIPDNKVGANTTVKCSTLNVNRSNIIEGIDFYAKNCRYALHDETGNNSLGHNLYRRIKNCRFIHESQPSATWNSPKAVGGGMGSGGRYDIENVYCEAHMPPLSYHNNISQGRNIMNIDGLITKSDNPNFDYDVSFGYYKENSLENMNYIYAKNCLLSKTMKIKQETTSVPSTNVFTLYKINVLENQVI